VRDALRILSCGNSKRREACGGPCRHELITPEIRPKSASTSKYVENVFFIKKPFSFFIFEKRLEE
jgi:hypothetical protein